MAQSRQSRPNAAGRNRTDRLFAHFRGRAAAGSNARYLQSITELEDPPISCASNLRQSYARRPTIGPARSAPIPVAAPQGVHGMRTALTAHKASGGEAMKQPTSINTAAFLPRLSDADRSSQPAVPITLIDINELSRRLSIAKGTLYNWVYLRRIPFVKAGRCVRFDYQEVLETLRQCPIIGVSASGRRII